MIQSILLNNKCILCFSVIIGYALWFFIAQTQYITHTYNVPLCFFQNDNNYTFIAPEYIKVTLYGPRKHLYYLNQQSQSIQFDLSNYGPGSHDIIVSKENLLLPESIKLVQLIPSHIKLDVSSK